eukprot:1085407-Amphidinium_carterae.2
MMPVATVTSSSILSLVTLACSFVVTCARHVSLGEARGHRIVIRPVTCRPALPRNLSCLRRIWRHLHDVATAGKLGMNT